MAKHALFFLFSLGILHTALAQDKWSEVYYTFGIGPFTQIHEACGDTLMDGKAYQVVWRTEFPPNSSSPDFEGRVAYFRESGDSLYVRMQTNSGPSTYEDAYYFFNVEVGDTILSFNQTFVVTQVDTVTILNEDRKQIRIDHIEYNFHDLWVEGIGSILNGFFHPGFSPYITDLTFLFSCYHSATADSIWGNIPLAPCMIGEVETECGSITFTQDSLTNLKIQAGPTPFSDVMNLSQLPPDSRLLLCDLVGKVVMIEQSSGQRHQLATGHLAPGLYLLQVTAKDGRTWEGRVVKY